MEDIVLINKMEKAVEDTVDQLFARGKTPGCSCERCKLDVIALALNSLPSKYVVTNIGNAVTNVALNSSQWQANLTMAVCNAIEIVRRKPRHN
jgi:competence protein ComFB